MLDPPWEAPRRVLRAGERVGGGVGPLGRDAGERERPRPSVSAGTVESGARTIQRSVGLEPVLGNEAARAAGRAEAAPEPVAQMTCSTPSTPPRRGSGPRAARARGARPTGVRTDRTAREQRRERGPLRRRRGVEAGQAALREERARQVERPPRRLASPHRDDLGAGRERVQPLGSGGHARRRRPSPRRRIVRLVGVHDAWIAAARRGRRDRDGRARAGRGERPRDRRARSPSVARTRSIAGAAGSFVPAASRHAPRRHARGTRRRSAGSGRRAEDERSGRAPRMRRARASPGNEAGRQWPSLSDRIRLCRIAAARAATPPPGRSVPKTEISSASTPPAQARTDRREPASRRCHADHAAIT